jgi:hypothetical protein
MVALHEKRVRKCLSKVKGKRLKPIVQLSRHRDSPSIHSCYCPCREISLSFPLYQSQAIILPLLLSFTTWCQLVAAMIINSELVVFLICFWKNKLPWLTGVKNRRH